ncbi:hypothetical protein JCM3775_000749 [Rhodotorula graminis]
MTTDMHDPLDRPTVRPGNPLQDAASDLSAPAPPPRHSPRLGNHTPPRAPPPPKGSSTSTRHQADRARSPPPPPGRRSPGAAAGPLSPQRPTSLAHAQSQQHQPADADLEHFADLCRKLYYDKDAEAARQVDSILQRLPAPFRTAYARTMSSIRSAFHRDEQVRRRAEVDSLLATTAPAATVKRLLAISPGSTSVVALRSAAARQHRCARLRAFVAANCTAAMPGPHPFFRALFAALWLQALDERKGGAGPRCVEWTVDVAVFTEAGGNEQWASEAVEVLKGVLGMTDRVCEPSHTDTFTTRTSLTASETDTSSAHHHHVGGEPVIAPVVFEPSSVGISLAAAGAKKQAPPVPPHRGSAAGSVRFRAGSDPFLEPHEKRSTRSSGAADAAGELGPVALEPLAPTSPLSPSVPLLSAHSPTTSSLPVPVPHPAPSSAAAAASSQYRTFTLAPYLSNPELRALCRLFPPFISAPARTAVAHLPARRRTTRSPAPRPGDLEAGGRGGKEEEEEVVVAQVGHGELRVGQARRDEGWGGTWWERLVLWLRALFGLI